MMFDPLNPQGTEWFSYDFVRDLPAGVTITGAASTQAVVVEGTDATPNSILSGGATYNGTVVSQLITGGAGRVDGVQYAVTFRATTSDGQTLARTVGLWIRS